MMQQRKLGNTGLSVSCLGFGAASLWGMPFFEERSAQEVLLAALDAGIKYIDTGPTYSRGNAEPRLARVLAQCSVRRDLVISTKAGTRVGRFSRLVKDFSPAWIRQSVEESLSRLHLDHLPLLLLHGPRIDDLNDDLLRMLDTLKQDGVIGHVGINSFDPDVLARLPAFPTIEVAMLDYNLLRLERETLIADLSAAGVGILAGEPLAQHVFTGRPLRLRGLRDLWYLARALRYRPQDLALRQRYAFMREHPLYTPAQLALAFVLSNPGVSTAVFSTTRMAHLQQNLQAADMTLPLEVGHAIRNV